MAGTEKRSRKQPDRFSVWKPGDKHAPMSVRIQEADKKGKKRRRIRSTRRRKRRTSPRMIRKMRQKRSKL